MFDHEKLDVYRCGLELYAKLAPAAASFPRGHGAIVDQLRRAMLSIPLNIAEAASTENRADALSALSLMNQLNEHVHEHDYEHEGKKCRSMSYDASCTRPLGASPTNRPT